MHCYMEVTRNWSLVVSPKCIFTGKMKPSHLTRGLNKNQDWTYAKKNQASYAETTKLTSHKSIIKIKVKPENPL
jgi:hypothetical protein